ncbi:MAG: recombinase family protein [Bacteroidota bacterium]
MIYAYLRVSSDKQSVENQRFEILKYADNKKLTIDEWVEETVSSRKKLEDRLISSILNKLTEGDLLMV